MSNTAPSRPIKSTNVRTLPWTLRAVGAGLRALERGSPSLTATVGVPLMFRTQRFRPTEDERRTLASAERFVVSSKVGELAAWSWGAGPAVLLVHGWNGRGGQLSKMVAPLVGRGLRVVTFDAPGHGETAGHTASLPAFADAIDAMVAHVASPFLPLHAVVAHSMGGAAVTYAMSRYLHADGREHERAFREGLPVRRFAFVAPPVDVRDFVRGFTRMAGLGDATRRAIGRRMEARLSVRLEDLYAPSLARELEAPLLVVHDEDDREVPLACGRKLAEAWPGAELEITRGLGHVRILADAAVIERVASFVAG